jgi:uncharacterized membrane protein YdjX (TVP38/TMEM64 family)
MNSLMDNIYITVKQAFNFVTWSRVAKGLFIAFYLVILVVISLNFDLRHVQAYINQHQNLAVLISLFVIFLSSLAFIPTIPLTLFTSVMFGPLMSTLITTLATSLAALVHYQLGKQLGDVVHFNEKKARLPFKLDKLPINSPLFLLLGRIIPGGPTGLSFVCGAYCVSFPLYLWTTFVMSLLGSALIAFSGHGLIKL